LSSQRISDRNISVHGIADSIRARPLEGYATLRFFGRGFGAPVLRQAKLVSEDTVTDHGEIVPRVIKLINTVMTAVSDLF
jgi:hypothetical protein